MIHTLVIGLSSFQERDAKLDRVFAENKHTRTEVNLFYDHGHIVGI